MFVFAEFAMVAMRILFASRFVVVRGSSVSRTVAVK